MRQNCHQEWLSAISATNSGNSRWVFREYGSVCIKIWIIMNRFYFSFDHLRRLIFSAPRTFNSDGFRCADTDTRISHRWVEFGPAVGLVGRSGQRWLRPTTTSTVPGTRPLHTRCSSTNSIWSVIAYLFALSIHGTQTWKSNLKRNFHFPFPRPKKWNNKRQTLSLNL